jgi:hypothetical protein
MRILKVLSLVSAACLLASLSYAATPDRIASAIDAANVVELKWHVSPQARAQFDQGAVEPSRAMHLTMLLTPTAAQQQDLNTLIANQQTPGSPLFHKWLTPEQFGARFGLSQGDLDRITTWLESQGFKVSYTARGHAFLSFDGNAGLVESVFKTEIHSFNVNGKMHFANVIAPSIPAALSGIVGGFRGLHDFLPHSMLKQRANYTLSTGSGDFTFLAPPDLATIYDINPLYTAGNDGTGQSIVIAGQTDVYIADLNFFRAAFGISAISGCTMDGTGTIIKAGACSSGNFEMVVPVGGGVTDPGISSGDLSESDLDIETVSGVARGAKIIFVTADGAHGGVDSSANWAIDNQLAPVISYSYGLCEAFDTAPTIATQETIYQQGSTEGIAFFAATGDNGSAECDGDNGTYPAILGPSVSYPASSPEITGVGGTEFNEGSCTYWSATNTNGGSALSYIPELAWNDPTSIVGSQFDATGGGPSNCAHGTGTTSVGGFAFEICDAPTAGGIAKPTWQAGITPADSVRDVPDISFSASNVNDPYIVCTPQNEIGGTGTTSSCATSIADALEMNSAFGGTSASTPLAAAMDVLLNQYLGGQTGPINNYLYTVIYKNHASVFHDVTAGTSANDGDTSTNIEPCTAGDPTFEPAALRCPGGGTFGYTAGTGYDTVTGLGSLDINAFFTAWGASRPATATTISPSATNINQGGSVTFTATVTPPTVTGSVGFFNNGSTTAIGTATVAGGVASFTTTGLPAGADSVTATFGGDATDGSSTSVTPAVVTVVAGTFTLAANPTTANVVAGHSVNSTITLTPGNGFAAAVTYSCSTGFACTFNPPSPTAATSVVATITTAATLAAGPATVTISGVSGSATGSALVNLTVTATDQSFTLAPQTATYQVIQGQSVNATIVLTPANGFNTALTYTCADTAPESVCTGPQGPTANATASFAITTTLAGSSARQARGPSSRIFYAALLPGLLGIVFTFGSSKRSARGMRMLGLIMVMGFSTLWLGSCGGNSGSTVTNPGTPKGNYTITINATTGGAAPITGATTFTLTVQ